MQCLTRNAIRALVAIGFGLYTQLVCSNSSNHNAPIYKSVESCITALTAAPQTALAQTPPVHSFSLVSWNIQKGKNVGWKAELGEIANNADIILLQEAVRIPEMQQPPKQSVYWSFAEGYGTARYKSGLLTVTRTPPDVSCILSVKEPLLRTRKMMSITRLPNFFQNSSLLLVNIHAVNFTIGTKRYREQLDMVSQILNSYSGPTIVSGDMNTWNTERMSAFNVFTEQNKLDAVTFSPDQRIKKFDHILDYILVKNLHVVSGKSNQTKNSDHNPLFATFIIED